MRDLKKQYARQNQWKADNQDRIYLYVPKGMKDVWKQKAKDAGMTLTEYIVSKVN